MTRVSCHKWGLYTVAISKRRHHMRRILTALVLTSVLWAGFWPLAGMADEPLEREAPAAVTLPSGFSSFTAVSGLTDPRGLVAFPPFPLEAGFRSGYYVVEKSLNRVSFAFQRGTPIPFATGLSNPTDLVAPRDAGATWGIAGTPNINFLYVAEAGANRISRIDKDGVVTTFANLPASPEHMAFSNVGGGSAFGDNLFVTLSDGRIVKVDPNGTVSPCTSGLSSPRGLVFGPGGALRTTVLYVVEMTANRISRIVDPTTCAASSFATGLSSPVALAISPAPPWGPLDTTLYVVNAGTEVNRVAQTGTVTSFIPGFAQATAVRFDAFMPVDDRLNSNLRVADAAGGAAGAGTIVEVNVRRPSISNLSLTCNPSPCRAGSNLSVSLTLTYDGPIPLPVEIKTGFQLADGTPINVSPVPKHFEVTLPPGFTTGVNPIPLLSLTWPGAPTVPPGRYCFQASLTDPEIAIRAFLNRRTCFVSAP